MLILIMILGMIFVTADGDSSEFDYGVLEDSKFMCITINPETSARVMYGDTLVFDSDPVDTYGLYHFTDSDGGECLVNPDSIVIGLTNAIGDVDIDGSSRDSVQIVIDPDVPGAGRVDNPNPTPFSVEDLVVIAMRTDSEWHVDRAVGIVIIAALLFVGILIGLSLGGGRA